MSEPRPPRKALRPAPPPPDMPMTPFALVGTALWLGAALLMWPFQDSLVAAGRGWWLPTAWAGVALGLLGTFVMILHDRRRGTGRP